MTINFAVEKTFTIRVFNLPVSWQMLGRTSICERAHGKEDGLIPVTIPTTLLGLEFW
jgi:hypothetical protein